MWDEITYPFPNSNGSAIEVWEWIGEVISSHTSRGMWLLIHARIISWTVLVKEARVAKHTQIETHLKTCVSIWIVWTDYSVSLLWRHNGRGSVSNHKPHDCLLNRLFRRRSKKTSKLRVTGLCLNSPGTGEFPAQMASYAENVSIWWCHHVIGTVIKIWLWCQPYRPSSKYWSYHIHIYFTKQLDI